jgi:hypothetical protein
VYLIRNHDAERATGLEPATSSLGSTLVAHELRSAALRRGGSDVLDGHQRSSVSADACRCVPPCAPLDCPGPLVVIGASVEQERRLGMHECGPVQRLKRRSMLSNDQVQALPIPLRQGGGVFSGAGELRTKPVETSGGVMEFAFDH